MGFYTMVNTYVQQLVPDEIPMLWSYEDTLLQIKFFRLFQMREKTDVKERVAEQILTTPFQKA